MGYQRRVHGSLSGKGKRESYSQAAKSDIAGNMKVTFKTLDQRSFDLEVGSDEGVEDLICKMEDRLGQENLYRLICAGKMMHEGEMMSDYKMTGKLPVEDMEKMVQEMFPEDEEVRKIISSRLEQVEEVA